MSLPVRKSEDPEAKAALAMLGARERFLMLLEIAADHHVSFSGWALEFDAAAQKLVRRFGALQEIGIPPSGVVKVATSRLGSGKLPMELAWTMAHHIHQ